MAVSVNSAVGVPSVANVNRDNYRIQTPASEFIHSDAVYNVLLNACTVAEDRLQESLKLYQEHPDVQANLQQLQYDLASWNLTLTTMTNINKSMADALNSIASNFR